MKKIRFILACVVLGAGLAVIAGYFIRSYRANNFLPVQATIIEANTKTLGFLERLYWRPLTVFETTIRLRYNMNGVQHTGEIRTGKADAYTPGATIQILCNKQNPAFIELNQ